MNEFQRVEHRPLQGFSNLSRRLGWAVVPVIAAGALSTAVAADSDDPILRLFLKKGMVTEAELQQLKAEAEASRTNTVSDLMLNLFLNKGLITQEEVDRTKAETAGVRARPTGPVEEAQPATLPAPESKWKLSKALKNIELFGDIRLRYESRSAEDPAGESIELDRFRYAVRLGLRGELFDDFYYGVRLDTGANPRSSWLTLGTAATASPSYQGPFGKSTAGINIGQAYLGWRGADWLEITAGKMSNPLYTTPMVWDGDLAPEGLVERFRHQVGKASLFATFGQFLYQDTNPTHAPSGYFGGSNFYPSVNGSESSLALLLAWQAGLEFQINKDVSFKVASVLYNYAGDGVNNTANLNVTAPGFSDVYVGQGATNGVAGFSAAAWSGYPSGRNGGFNANQTGLNDLLVLEIPWEVNFSLGGLRSRVYGDVAYNLGGSDRARAAYLVSNSPEAGAAQLGGIRPIPSAQTDQNHAYLVGMAVGNIGTVTGQVSKKNTWEARAYWQHVEQYALDPNLLDSDFFEGRANLEGVAAAVAYSLTDNLIGTFRYGYGWRINEDLGTGGSNGDMAQMNPIEHFNLLQVDFTLKF